jgi:hypothetical protein
MPYEVITHRDRGVKLGPYTPEPYYYGEVIPDEAFDFLPKGERTRRVLLDNGWVKPTNKGPTAKKLTSQEPEAVKIDDDLNGRPWPRHHGGPWFLTPDGQKHRGKKRALAHMGAL